MTPADRNRRKLLIFTILYAIFLSAALFAMRACAGPQAMVAPMEQVVWDEFPVEGMVLVAPADSLRGERFLRLPRGAFLYVPRPVIVPREKDPDHAYIPSAQNPRMEADRG